MNLIIIIQVALTVACMLQYILLNRFSKISEFVRTEVSRNADSVFSLRGQMNQVEAAIRILQVLSDRMDKPLKKKAKKKGSKLVLDTIPNQDKE